MSKRNTAPPPPPEPPVESEPIKEGADISAPSIGLTYEAGFRAGYDSATYDCVERMLKGFCIGLVAFVVLDLIFNRE